MKNQESKNQEGMLEHLASKHKDWVRIAKSFTGNYEDAQDLVQNMYIRVFEAGKTKADISYGSNDVNRYFVWTVLYNMYLTDYRKGNSSKAIKTFPLLEEQDDTIADNYTGDKHQSFEVIMDKITDLVSGWDVNDKQLFELYYMQGQSLRKIAEGTGIGLSWVHNSVKAIKGKLIAELGEDVTDFFNDDFDYLLNDVA
jgi:RNA polymerase sigma factor (sigma-70 family)